MNNEQIATYLDEAGDVAEVAARVEPPIAPGALIAAALLHLGAELARKGLDPVVHITRVLDLSAGLNAASGAADAAARAKFGE